MQWNMIILYKNNEDSRMSITSLMEALSTRYRERNLPDGYKVYSKEISSDERHYFFSPTVSKIAKDILISHNAFQISTPESLNGLRQITL